MFILLFLLLLIDSIYLKFIGYPLFSKNIKKITNEDIKFNYLGFLSYLFISYGLYHFVIKSNKNIYDALIDAFILGIIIYGTYDFTNIGIFKNYDILTGVVDTLWGGILLSLTTYFYYKLI